MSYFQFPSVFAQRRLGIFYFTLFLASRKDFTSFTDPPQGKILYHLQTGNDFASRKDFTSFTAPPQGKFLYHLQTRNDFASRKIFTSFTDPK